MTEREALAKIEEIVDVLGLSVTLANLGGVCAEKAEHLRCNWQDKSTARVWDSAGTRTENMQDSKRKGRNFIPAGELHPRAKLTAAIVQEIRERYRPHTRGLGWRSLSYVYPVSERTIRAIVRRETWRHI